MKKYPMVEVEWVDSVRTGGWRTVEDYERAAGSAVCRSIGYTFKSNRKDIVLVQSLDPGNGNVTDSISIPRSAVRKVTRLEHKP